MMLMTRACRSALESGSAEVVMTGRLQTPPFYDASTGMYFPSERELPLYGYDFAEGSCVLSLDAMPSGALRAGGAFVQAFECELVNFDGRLDGWDFTGETELEVTANVKTGDLYESVGLGTFRVVEASGDGFSIRLRCEDRLGYLDVPYREMGESEFPTTLGALVRDLFRQMVETYGRYFLPLANSCTFPGDDFTVSRKPALGGMTCLDVLDRAMEAVGNFAWMDRSGHGLKLMAYASAWTRLTVTDGLRDGQSFWDHDGGYFLERLRSGEYGSFRTYYAVFHRYHRSALEAKLSTNMGRDYENGCDADGNSSDVADYLDGGLFARLGASDVAAWVGSEVKPGFTGYMKAHPDEERPPGYAYYAPGELPEGQSWSVRRAVHATGTRTGAKTQVPMFSGTLYLTSADGKSPLTYRATAARNTLDMAVPVEANPFIAANSMLYGNIIRGSWARYFEDVDVEAVVGFWVEPGDMLLVDSDKGVASRTCITSCRHVIGGSSTLSCHIGNYTDNHRKWLMARGLEDE